MATARRKIDLDRSALARVGHYFNDPVRECVPDPASLSYVFLFQSGREGVLQEGCDLSAMQFRERPKTFCVSCGEEPHVSTFDWLGRCQHSITKFWNRARKVYWHRYSKEKQLPNP